MIDEEQRIVESMATLKASLDAGILEAMGITEEAEKQAILNGPALFKITFGRGHDD